MEKQESIKVGILGATGMVGQRFIQLLQNHPRLKVHAVGASSRSAGQTFESACNWKLDTPIPLDTSQLVVQECKPENFVGCKIIFSGLDSSVAGHVEEAFRAAEFCLFSNAKNHRMDQDVPLVVPLVNADHLDLIRHQQKIRNLKTGFIVTNANCSTTGLVVALKPLHEKYEITQLEVVTLQAISGAGYPGISSLDILGNVVPFIDGEEDKIETEPVKILASLSSDNTSLVNASFIIDACCNRVPVIDGHTECISLKFARPPSSLEEVSELLNGYESQVLKAVKVHSAPKQAIKVLTGKDRPQPRLDLMTGGGYAVTVGRLRRGNYWDLKFTILSHNTILGAAGSSIMNAELALEMNLIR